MLVRIRLEWLKRCVGDMAEFTQSLTVQAAAAIAALMFFVLYYSAAFHVTPPNLDVAPWLQQLFGAILALLVSGRKGA